MTTLGALHAAIAVEDFPGALELALTAWRATRATSLVALVDAVAARCRTARSPTRDTLHDWWIEHAAKYDPVTATALLDRFEIGLDRDDVEWAAIRGRYRRGSNPILYAVIMGAEHTMASARSLATLDRVAAMVDWPDDPRVARALVRILAVRTPPWHPSALQGLYTAIVAWLVRLGDASIRPLLEACVREPRGREPFVRELQQREARRALDALPDLLAFDFDPVVLATCARLTGERSPVLRQRDAAEAALWEQVAESPEDLAPRMILADLLAERGDPRGELIALQCGGEAGELVSELIDDHWDAWLGDLALVVTREGTTFERGMLATVRIGPESSPEWAFGKLRGHRELAVVHTVRRAQASPTQYAELIAGLRRLPAHLQIDTPELLSPLYAVAARWPTTTLEYSEGRPHEHLAVRRAPEHHLDQLAAMFPELTALHLTPWRGFDNTGSRSALIATLPVRFPKLQRIVIDLQGLRIYEPGMRAEIEAIAALPLVEWPTPPPHWPSWTVERMG